MLIRRVVALHIPQDGPIERRPLATFYLEADELRVVWHDELGQRFLESSGVRGDDRRVWPSEGRAFWDALPQAFKRASTTVLEEAEVPAVDVPRSPT